MHIQVRHVSPPDRGRQAEPNGGKRGGARVLTARNTTTTCRLRTLYQICSRSLLQSLALRTLYQICSRSLLQLLARCTHALVVRLPSCPHE